MAAQINSGLFTKKELELLEAPELGYQDWYVENFQRRFASAGAVPMTLQEVMDATHRVEAIFKQNPVDPKQVKKVAKAIFIEDHAQVKPIQIARLVKDDTELFYNVGGRHRAYAILGFMQQLSEGDEAYNDQLIEVQMTEIADEADLVKFIVADNTSRALRAAEAGHLDLQVFGAKAEGVKSVISTAMKADVDTKKQEAMLAQYYVRMSQSTKVIKPETAISIGKKVTKYIFGMMKSPEYSKLNLQQIGRLMARSWDITVAVIDTLQNDEHNPVTNIGRAAGKVGDMTVSQLGNEFDAIIKGDAAKPGKKRHLEVVNVIPQVEDEVTTDA